MTATGISDDLHVEIDLIGKVMPEPPFANDRVLKPDHAGLREDVRWDGLDYQADYSLLVAILVRDLEGGVIMKTAVPGFGEHYYNQVKGEDVDLAKRFFPDGTVVPSGSDAQITDFFGGNAYGYAAFLATPYASKYLAFKDEVFRVLFGARAATEWRKVEAERAATNLPSAFTFPGGG